MRSSPSYLDLRGHFEARERGKKKKGRGKKKKEMDGRDGRNTREINVWSRPWMGNCS